MKKRYIAGMMAGVAVIAIFTICFTQGKKENIKDEKELITIGFSQVGAESDWRTANSISIKETFTPERGYDLIFEDARQDQSNQIMAIRSFIQQDVDYIIFSPVVEDGWDTVLEEAKRARIPVIVIDRMVNVKDDSLYTAWVGSDFYMQGEKACAALKAYVDAQEMEKVNIVHIQGTLGATAQIARTQALTEAASRYGWNIVAHGGGSLLGGGSRGGLLPLKGGYDLGNDPNNRHQHGQHHKDHQQAGGGHQQSLADAQRLKGINNRFLNTWHGSCPPYQPRVTSRSSVFTVPPTLTATDLTVPSTGAETSISIFMASSTISTSPAFTAWPGLHSTLKMLPGMGLFTAVSPAATAALIGWKILVGSGYSIGLSPGN